MQLTDVLLVSRNYQGLHEENFLTTIGEFIEEYCSSDGRTDIGALKNAVLSTQPYEWGATYYAWGNDTYDMRLCQGSDDLLNFLSGEYNDSIEDMEDRNPGTAGMYDGWYWYNNADNFSILAIEAVKEHVQTLSSNKAEFEAKLFKVMPEFPFKNNGEQTRTASLADVIKAAQVNTSSSAHHPKHVSHNLEI